MRDTSKALLIKVDTDLGTRLLVVIEPHLLVEDLQGDLPQSSKQAENIRSFPWILYEVADPFHEMQKNG
jgi:hypothetical protein